MDISVSNSDVVDIVVDQDQAARTKDTKIKVMTTRTFSNVRVDRINRVAPVMIRVLKAVVDLNQAAQITDTKIKVEDHKQRV